MIVTVTEPGSPATPVVVEVRDGGPGADGASAYKVAIENGFTGTEAEWLASLQGAGGVADVVAPLVLTEDVLSLTVGAGGVAAHDDARFTEPRTPTAHAATHGAAGSDPVTVVASQVTGLTAASVGLGSVDNVAAVELRDRTTHTGTQTSATIADFTEAVQDAVAQLLGAGSNVTLTYDDAADTLTVAAAGGTTDPEAVRDAIGVALVGVGVISVAVDDAADTITITSAATVNSTDAALRDRGTHSGEQAIATVTGLQAALDDKVDSTDARLAPEVVYDETPPTTPTLGLLYIDTTGAGINRDGTRA